MTTHQDQEAAMTLHRLTVADVMTVDPITVREDAPIEAATQLLSSYHVTGLPVLDQHDRLVGVVSRTDLLAIEPWLRAVVRGKPDGLRVGEIMTSPAVTVPMSASLVEAARLMRDSMVHRLVAIDDDGRPVGILSGSDYVALAAES